MRELLNATRIFILQNQSSMKKTVLIVFMLYVSVVKANNVQLSNISVTNNAGNTGKVIHFDVSWENSWRTSSTNNWDGVWVFFKFKDNDGSWHHLNFTGTNVNMPVGAAYDMGSNAGNIGIGMFIYRSANGSGTVTLTDVKAGIQSYPGTFDVKGFVIEMVYMPQGSFWVGDGGNYSNYMYQDGTTGNPHQITGTSITIGTATGDLNDPYYGGIPVFTGTLTNFPSGYGATWIMKYELSLGAYRDYLNTLSYAQQAAHLNSPLTPQSGTNTIIIGPSVFGGSYRGIIKIKTTGSNAAQIPAIVGCDLDGDNIYDEANDGEWLAAGCINWPDAAAYLDWAGLRPMTELEYEKACRGPLTPVSEEFAWGTNQVATNEYLLASSGQSGENITNAPTSVGNASYQPTTYNATFPYLPAYNVRGGIFASAISTRVSAGAGYYGAMELSGNLYEFCVPTTWAAGRSFAGKHGDGVLTIDGYADENKWPGINGNADNTVANTNFAGSTGVTNTAGIYNKGGSFGVVALAIRVSYRNGGTMSLTRSTNAGIRGVRDAN